MKLVDTSAWIEFLRGTGTPTALQVRELLAANQAAWCEMVAVELSNGVPATQRGKLEALEALVTLMPINNAVWRLARLLAQAARAGGVTVPSTDLIIAACARQYHLEIEHHQDQHFELLESVEIQPSTS